MAYQVNYLDNISDVVSPDDFDSVKVILVRSGWLLQTKMCVMQLAKQKRS